jgi:Protein of unknown function (DUF3106)
MSGFRSLRGLLSKWALGAALFVVSAVQPAWAQAKNALPRPPALPTRVLERLAQMTPEQRQKALARLPPERRERVEQQLNRLDQLPPDQKAQVLERYDAFQGLPRDRQAAVRAELQALRKMAFARRRARLNSPEFEQTFSPEEQRLLRESFPFAARQPARKRPAPVPGQ